MLLGQGTFDGVQVLRNDIARLACSNLLPDGVASDAGFGAGMRITITPRAGSSSGPAGALSFGGAAGPSVDLVAGKVTLTTACGGFCSGFRFRPEGYTAPPESQAQEIVELPIGPGATMSDVTFTLSSPPPAGHALQVGFSDGQTFHFCRITTGTSCSPAGSVTFDGPVWGFIDTSYVENTGRRVSFTWKRTF